MLCLSQHTDDQINLYLKTPAGLRPIGFVKTLELGHGRVKLGFEMPPGVVIVRDEADANKKPTAKR
jgi:hypothetical protein